MARPAGPRGVRRSTLSTLELIRAMKQALPVHAKGAALQSGATVPP